MFCGVTPSTSQRRESPSPTSTVTTRWLVESGSVATWRITPSAAALLKRAPAGERLNSHSANGIITRIAMNQSADDKAVDVIGVPFSCG